MNELSEERITHFYNSCIVSKEWINAVVGGDLSWFVPDDISLYGDLTQATINKHMQNNIDFIESILAYPQLAADSRSKVALNNAVTRGKTYISNNS